MSDRTVDDLIFFANRRSRRLYLWYCFMSQFFTLKETNNILTSITARESQGRDIGGMLRLSHSLASKGLPVGKIKEAIRSYAA